MSDTKFCHNHPNGKAIAACHECAVNLCGMCGNYADDIVLCERCVEVYENAKYVSSQTEKLIRPDSALVVDDPDGEGIVPPGRRKQNNTIVPAVVIGICSCIIALQLYLYSNPAAVEQDPAAIARQQAISSLVQCMLVFREIGLILQDGRMPDNTMICADSTVPNVVSNAEGTLRISHPNPQHYGYAEISVSDEDPEPRISRIEQ